MDDQGKLQQRIVDQRRRAERAEREKRTLFSASVYVGSLGLQLVLPAVGGGYLGRWLDGLGRGYSTQWTVSLILLGVFVGIVNVYLTVRKRP